MNKMNESIEIYREAKNKLNAFYTENDTVWGGKDYSEAKIQYNDLKSQYTPEQIREKFPDLAEKLMEIKTIIVKLETDRALLTKPAHEAKINALHEIGFYFSEQCKDDAIADAYLQSQEFREQHLDGINIPLEDIESNPLIIGFCEALNISEEELNEIINSSLEPYLRYP